MPDRMGRRRNRGEFRFGPESPDFKKWMQSVAAMPAEKQVDAVSRKLKELNPEFDGKLSAYPCQDQSAPHPSFKTATSSSYKFSPTMLPICRRSAPSPN